MSPFNFTHFRAIPNHFRAHNCACALAPLKITETTLFLLHKHLCMRPTPHMQPDTTIQHIFEKISAAAPPLHASAHPQASAPVHAPSPQSCTCTRQLVSFVAAELEHEELRIMEFLSAAPPTPSEQQQHTSQYAHLSVWLFCSHVPQNDDSSVPRSRGVRA